MLLSSLVASLSVEGCLGGETITMSLLSLVASLSVSVRRRLINPLQPNDGKTCHYLITFELRKTENTS